MKTKNFYIVVACAGLFGACATATPRELLNARQAYQDASAGPAARVAPAELHVAGQALVRAENSFKNDPDSYMTRDLAYVAQRKAEIAAATASVAIAQEDQARADRDFSAVQSNIVDKTKMNLSQARSDLEASKRSGDKARTDLAASERSGDQAAQDLSQARTDLAASEQSGALTAERLSAEQEARAAAEQRAAVAQAALAKLADVKDEPRGMVITLSGSVLFASNRSVLLPNAKARLDRVADVLLTNRERNITIEGHTDSRGSDSHNLELSQARADSVRNFLMQRGYEADLIKARGLGEGHPVGNNANAEGRANNRRVEIIIDSEGYTSAR
jgi:outer membrane protein OmpA-like peptidoglycan-associated protein